jgi:CRISPR-associated protein Cas2
MLVMCLERVPQSLRGELSRWLIEPRPGVFVGGVTAMVRDRLWKKCCSKATYESGVVQIWTTNNEQGFDVRTYGALRREVVDFEGLKLVRRPAADKH